MKMKRLIIAAESTGITEQQLSLPKLSLFLILRNVSVLFLSLIPYNHENPDMFHTITII